MTEEQKVVEPVEGGTDFVRYHDSDESDDETAIDAEDPAALAAAATEALEAAMAQTADADVPAELHALAGAVSDTLEAASGADDPPEPPAPTPAAKTFSRQAPKASVAAAATAAGATAAASSGGVASRWEALQAEHRSHQADKLEQQKTAISADVRDKFRSLELKHVRSRVAYFNRLFAGAIEKATKETKIMAQGDRALAAAARTRRRAEAAAQRAEDAAERRAPRPAIENVAAHPDELKIAMSRAPRGMKHVYALVDVSKLEEESAAGVADESHAWRSYERPLHFTAPGRYAVLTKTVPLPRPGQTLASFEERAAVAEATSSVPEGYAALGNALVDAVAAGLLDRDGAFEILELCATGQVDDPYGLAREWREKVADASPALARRRATERAQRAKATRAAAAAATVEGLAFAEAGGGDVVALGAAGDGVFGGGRERVELGAVLCRIQIFNTTSMCAYATALTRALRRCFENSRRAIDSPKDQPNRLRCDRDFHTGTETSQTRAAEDRRATAGDTPPPTGDGAAFPFASVSPARPAPNAAAVAASPPFPVLVDRAADGDAPAAKRQKA